MRAGCLKIVFVLLDRDTEFARCRHRDGLSKENLYSDN